MDPRPLAFLNRITQRARQASTNDIYEIEFLDLTGAGRAPIDQRFK